MNPLIEPIHAEGSKAAETKAVEPPNRSASSFSAPFPATWSVFIPFFCGFPLGRLSGSG